MLATGTKRAYIAGPMTGLPNYNYGAFDEAEARLSVYVTPLNPAKHFGGDQTRERKAYLSAALGTVIFNADLVVVLPGWENSPGARVEVHAAQEIGLFVYELEDFIEAHDNGVEPSPIRATFTLNVYNNTEPVHTITSEGCQYCPLTHDKPETRPVSTVFLSVEERLDMQNPDKTLLDEIVENDELPPRADVLAEAQRLITGDRNNQYGPPTQDFQRTADMWTALGYRRLDPEGKPLEMVPSDVAICVACVKLSRLMHQRQKRDNWTDLAGYAGCGFECSQTEGI